MMQISCDCDDGWSVVVNSNENTTCMDLLREICSIRNSHSHFPSLRPDGLCAVFVTNESCGIQSLLYPHVNLWDTIGMQRRIKVFGCKQQLQFVPSHNSIISAAYLQTFGSKMLPQFAPICEPQAIKVEDRKDRQQIISPKNLPSIPISSPKMSDDKSEKGRRSVEGPDSKILMLISCAESMLSESDNESDASALHRVDSAHSLTRASSSDGLTTSQQSTDDADSSSGDTEGEDSRSSHGDKRRGDFESEDIDQILKKRKRLSKSSCDTPLRHLFIPDPVALEKRRMERQCVSETDRDFEWDERFDMMLEYDRVYGTCNVPQHLICRLGDGTEVRLGTWLNSQRMSNKKGKLHQDRINRLQTLVETGRLSWTCRRSHAVASTG